ncbi:MAG: DNA N-6-adenine-methyltransferase [Desulfuromonadales bacterium]
MQGLHQSRLATGKDEWLTPKEMLDVLGPFDLDPCSPTVRPWPTARLHFTIEDDGLTSPWPLGCSVWMNPPYGRATGTWLNKLANHAACENGDGIALIFARTETKMFFEYVWPLAHAILFIKGRIRFCDTQGKPGAHAPAPSCLVAYGEKSIKRIMRYNSNLQHKVIIL